MHSWPASTSSTQYLPPLCSSPCVLPEVPAEISPRSYSSTRKPRICKSRAIAQPVNPPPMMAALGLALMFGTLPILMILWLFHPV